MVAALINERDEARGALRGIADAVEPEAMVRTDDWSGYRGLAAKGYAHRPTPMRSPSKSTEVVLPRVPLVFSLLKRWLLSTHQGAVRHSHLDCYLDEFTFRFNRASAGMISRA